jgi:hypothetical protein
LKSFPRVSRKLLFALCGAAFTILAAGWLATARGALPTWIRNIEGRTEIEAAFFRRMALPGGEVAFRRPPRETRPALGDLLKKQPGNAELYSLRALEDEQQLDFDAAETDWKKFEEKSTDKPAAQLSLADFYHRRLRPLDEIKALSGVASALPEASEKLTPASEQRSWSAFERIFGVIRAQGLPAEVSVSQYRSWLARYPQEPSLYVRFLDYLISVKDFSTATQLIAQYHAKFPADEILPVKARALVEYRQGSLQQGLAVYEKDFQPLWAWMMRRLRKMQIRRTSTRLRASSITTSSRASSTPRRKPSPNSGCARTPLDPLGLRRSCMSVRACSRTFMHTRSPGASTSRSTTARA